MDAVLGDAIDGGAAAFRIRAIDHLGINGGAHGLDDALAGALGREVNRAGAVPAELDARLLRRDERLDCGHDVAARLIVRGDLIRVHLDAGADRGDTRVHNQTVGDAREFQRDQFRQRHGRAVEESLHVGADQAEDDGEDNKGEETADTEESD